MAKSVSPGIWRLTTLIAICALMLSIVHGAAADDISVESETDAESSALAAPGAFAGKARGLGDVFVRGSSESVATISRQLTRLVTTKPLVVPTNQKQRFLIRFSGESRCEGPVGAFCSVRVMVGNNIPFPGRPLVFDSTFRTDPTRGDIMNNTVEYVTGCLDPGSYPIKVDYGVGQATGSDSTEFRFFHWLIVVEQLNNCA